MIVYVLKFSDCEEDRIEDVFDTEELAMAWADAIDVDEYGVKIEALDWGCDGDVRSREVPRKFADATWSVVPCEVRTRGVPPVTGPVGPDGLRAWPSERRS